jgi:hypothetical protein
VRRNTSRQNNSLCREIFVRLEEFLALQKGSPLKIFSAILVTTLISGCVSTFYDARPVETQQADLDGALTALAGPYDVIDARNDFYNFTKFDGRALIIIRTGQSASFLLVGGKETLLIDGNECTGYVDRNSPRLICHPKTRDFIVPGIELATKDHEITLSGLFSGKPMLVKAGDYVFDVIEAGSGRSHYYLLRKKPAAAPE